MTEHHGLDLDAIAEASGGHSIFAPSASYGWLTCADYILANIFLPDDAGEDAAEGTVGHEVGEDWLLALAQDEADREAFLEDGSLDDWVDMHAPVHRVGEIRKVVERSATFDIEITEDMLSHVRKYVMWCFSEPGVHYIEQRVDFSKITPIPNQGGTADHAACQPRRLVITDLKYGKGIHVSAAEDINNPFFWVNGALNGNPQALLYALGFFYMWDHLYHFEEIVIRIAQPRREHFETWVTTRQQLLAFARYAKIKASDAWQPERTRTASKKGCQWCKVKNCAALAAWLDDAVEGVFDPVSEIIEGEYRVVSEDRALAVREKLDDAGLRLDTPSPMSLSTAQMAKLLPMRKTIEKFFQGIHEELEYRARSGEDVPDHVLVDGREGDRKYIEEAKPLAVIAELEFLGLEPEETISVKPLTPPQAEEALRKKFKLTKKAAEALLAPLVSRTPGKPTLVHAGDKRARIEDDGSVFEPVEDEL